MTDKIELTEDERWCIVENLIENYYGLQSMDDYEVGDALKTNESVLDKLSPNWREADSCAAVETRQVKVEQGMDKSERNASTGYVGVRGRVLETVGFIYETDGAPTALSEDRQYLDIDVTVNEVVKRCEVMDWLEAFKDSVVEELRESSGLDQADQRHLQSKIQVMDELIEFFDQRNSDYDEEDEADA